MYSYRQYRQIVVAIRNRLHPLEYGLFIVWYAYRYEEWHFVSWIPSFLPSPLSPFMSIVLACCRWRMCNHFCSCFVVIKQSVCKFARRCWLTEQIVLARRGPTATQKPIAYTIFTVPHNQMWHATAAIVLFTLPAIFIRMENVYDIVFQRDYF